MGFITMGNQLPEEVAGASCIACGHCTAVCPTSAMDNTKAPLSGQVELGDYTRLDETQTELFLRSRRSIRKYLKKEVSREVLEKLVNLARFAPTAENFQGISFVAVNNGELIKKVVETCVQILEGAGMYPQITGRYRSTGYDVVLRGAPSVVLAVADKGSKYGLISGTSCLTYLELFAPSMGLGSCWAGFLQTLCGIEGSPIPAMFGIPAGKEVVGAVMLGYPKNKFLRLAERNPLEVEFI